MMTTVFPKNLFITGTDTDVGKTVVSALLMSGLNATYWKPIQAGLDEETDTQFVQRTSGKDATYFMTERFRLKTPMSPHAAADIDGQEIKLHNFVLPEVDTDHLLIEGAGGLIVPINWKDTVLDLIETFDVPVLLVARSGLGTLNHTLLSLQVLNSRGINVFGVVLNGPIHESNRETLKHFGKVPVWEVEKLNEIDSDSLSSAFLKVFS